jgi:GT2 family glycosyltransferase
MRRQEAVPGPAERAVLALVDVLAMSFDGAEAVEPKSPFYGQDASGDTEGYEAWIAAHPVDVEQLQRQVEALTDPPLISVVIPVYKPDLTFFWRCVESVRRQLYPHWELCLCDDGSEDPGLDRLLARLSSLDQRIRVTRLERNGGISAATNAAIGMTTGPFLAFMDHDDELTVDALAEVAITLGQNPTADVVYTDEDKIDEHDRRFAPFFKPGWSPDYLLTCAYTGHLSVIRRSLVEEVGLLRSIFDGSQDHDLLLRVTERTTGIVHIPKILYHWRAIVGSAAASDNAKPWAHEAGYAAVADALKRRGVEGTVLPGAFQGARRTKRAIVGSPKVSIIVPFRDGGTLLHRCVESIEATAGYDNRHVLLVDNGSREPETAALLRRLARREGYTVLRDDRPFNWSLINNDAVRHADGDLLLFLNNDIEGRSKGWLSSLVEHAQRPEVGAVGGRLLYPDGTIQHAGLIIGMGGVAGHAFRYCPTEYPGYFGISRVVRNYSAVTGACMMVRRSVFAELGGFDEDLGVAYNDVDFCLRLRDAGYLVVYTPYAELVHFESVTRGLGADGDENKRMLRRWRKIFEHGDPYFNPNLSLHFSEFRLGEKGEAPPWQSIGEWEPK